MADRPSTSSNQGKPGGGLILLAVTTAVVVTLAGLSPAALVLLLVGLVPSATAFVTERDPRRMLFRTVLPLNLAGVMWYVISLWHGERTVAEAFQFLRDPTTWLVMYGAAGAGSALHFGMPRLVTAILRDRLVRRRKAQEKLIEELKAEWGPGVNPEDKAEDDAATD